VYTRDSWWQIIATFLT